MALDLDSCNNFRISHRIPGAVKSGGVVSRVVYGHNATLVGKYVVAWGGYYTGTKPLYLYNHNRNEWQTLNLSNGSASAGAVEIMFIDGDIVYGVVFDRDGPDWRVIAVDMVLLKEFEVVSTLNIPQLNVGTAGAFLESRREMVLFGGGNDHLNVLNMDRKVWSKPRQKGRKPSRRSNHACCSYGNVLYFAGGSGLGQGGRELKLYILTVEARSYTWSIPKAITGHSPRNRYMLTLTCSSPNRIFAFGGFQGKQQLDMFALDSEEASGWHSITINGVGNGSSNHAAVQTKDFILLLGGYGFAFTEPCKITPLNL